MPTNCCADFRAPDSASRGFTLIEVLVALAVIAIGLLAVLSVASRGTQVASALQERNFANWIAQNEMARLHLSAKWPELGKSDDDQDFANRKWHWETEIAKTPDEDLRRATIKVSLADTPNDTITVLVGFLGRPPPQPVALPVAGANEGASSQSGTR